MKIAAIIVLCLGLAGCATVGEFGYGVGRVASGYQQARIDAAVEQRIGRRGYGYRPVYVVPRRRGWGRRW